MFRAEEGYTTHNDGDSNGKEDGQFHGLQYMGICRDMTPRLESQMEDEMEELKAGLIIVNLYSPQSGSYLVVPLHGGSPMSTPTCYVPISSLPGSLKKLSLNPPPPLPGPGMFSTNCFSS